MPEGMIEACKPDGNGIEIPQLHFGGEIVIKRYDHGLRPLRRFRHALRGSVFKAVGIGARRLDGAAAKICFAAHSFASRALFVRVTLRETSRGGTP